MNDQDIHQAFSKMLLAWLGVLWSWLTLSNVALTLTIVFTCLQIYKLVRELWWRKRGPSQDAGSGDAP